MRDLGGLRDGFLWIFRWEYTIIDGAEVWKGALMLKRILCDTATVAVQDADYYKMNLDYYLIEERFEEDGRIRAGYGIEIKKTALFRDGHTEAECKRISDIFLKREEAMVLIQKLVKNDVTPITLKYIVADYAENKVLAGA